MRKSVRRILRNTNTSVPPGLDIADSTEKFGPFVRRVYRLYRRTAYSWQLGGRRVTVTITEEHRLSSLFDFNRLQRVAVRQLILERMPTRPYTPRSIIKRIIPR